MWFFTSSNEVEQEQELKNKVQELEKKIIEKVRSKNIWNVLYELIVPGCVHPPFLEHP